MSDADERRPGTNPFRLDGEVGIISGGGTGLGFGMAQAMVDAGAAVVLTGRRQGVLQEAVERLGERASFVVADVTRSGSAQTVVEQTVERHGHILFIASMASLIGLPEVVAYSAAKAAHTGMVRSLAVELGAYGIRVNAIAPGWTESDMLHQALDADPPRKQKILGRIPGGAFGLPEDIGFAAVYLSSPAAKYVSGVVLPVDGGALVAL